MGSAKTANVLNKLPKSQQSKAKGRCIWMAETKKDALLAFDGFIQTWGVKYDRATECLIKDRDALLAFYDFRAEASAYDQCHRKLVRHTEPSQFPTPAPIAPWLGPGL
jgi:transposase-like protein